MKQDLFPEKIYMAYTAGELGFMDELKEPRDERDVAYIRADLVRNIEQDRDNTAMCADIIQAEYDEYKKKYSWHDVVKELPEDNEEVLVYNGFEYCIASVEHMKNGGLEWYCATDGYHTEDITHWMQIPTLNDNQQ